MSEPFKIVWTNISNTILTEDSFPVAFPATSSIPSQLQLRSNAADLATYEILKGVKFFLTGDPTDVNIVQNIWPYLGGPDKPELNGGYEISFDFGRTYIRFDSGVGVEGTPSTWYSLPTEAVGTSGIAETLGPFDTAHLVARVIIPPGANQFKKLDIQLGVDFDII